MALNVRIVATGTDELPTVGYFAYIKQKDAALYLDFSDNSFKAFASLVTPSIAYTEDPDQFGIWTFTHSLPVSYDGVITVISRDTINSLLVPDYEARDVGISGGEPLVDLARPETFIHTDLGGLDTLRVIDPNGLPVEGAIIRVYDKITFDAGDLDQFIGITSTNSLGRWVSPVPVNAGATYVILIHKPFVSGPINVEVSV